MISYVNKVLTVVFVFSVVLFPFSVYGAVGIYYGGKITAVHYCPCVWDAAIIITVSDIKTKRDIKLKYSWLYSTIRANYNIFTPGNQYVLGDATPGYTSCMQQSGYWCKSDSDNKADYVIGLIAGIGSSALSK